MTKEIEKKAEETTEAPAMKNWVHLNTHIFQWGPTKNAVILRDMAMAYNQVAAKHPKSPDAVRVISNALAKVNEMLNLVTLGFTAQRERRVYKDGEWTTVTTKTGFKEHLVYQVIDEEIRKFNQMSSIPPDMINLYRAVCKENINLRKAFHKAAAGKKMEYTAQDIVTWAERDYVVTARNAWKAKIGKKIKEYGVQGFYYGD